VKPRLPNPEFEKTDMYKRIIYENWHVIVPIISFITTVTVFSIMTLRGMLLRQEKAQRMSQLPLE